MAYAALLCVRSQNWAHSRHPCSAGRKDYGAALQMFLHALTVPSHVVNAITLEAYKKWILISLIHSGGQLIAAGQHVSCLG